MWGYLKGRLYCENPTPLDQLKQAIQTEIKLISPENYQCRDEIHAKTGRILHRVKRTLYEEHHLQEVVLIKSAGFRNPMLALVLISFIL